MKETLIKNLRESCQVKNKQVTWISELSDDQIYELYLRLRSQESAKSIARHIQNNWGVKVSSTPHSISQGILKFKKRIAHLLVAGIVPQNITHTKALQTFDGPLNELEKLARVADLQYARIERLMAEEEKTGIKNSYLSREIQALTTINKAILKTKAWIKLHGNYDPLNEQIEARKQKKLKKQFDRFLANSTVESRQRMIKASERFLELIEERAITLEKGPDGEYRFPS